MGHGWRITSAELILKYSLAEPCYIIGIMSGTSMDGVDAVLARMQAGRPQQLARSFVAYDDEFRNELIALNSPGADEIHRAALAANKVADLYGQAVRDVLAIAGMKPRDIAALGAHGQTVRHRPELGYTVQLLNGARLAETTGIRTICDFRPRDIAAGGQGAPLVPAFHAGVFGGTARNRVILNLGGIANVTVLSRGGNEASGFDTGPANVLLDYWCERHSGARFDADGQWAASGDILPDMLAAMLAEPFFALAPPKSTGRDLFSPQWLDQFSPDRFAPADVQATLLALTAHSIGSAIRSHINPLPEDVLVCGGGALNDGLMQALSVALAPAKIANTAVDGIDPLSVEALAFAWLAWRTLQGQPGNLPSATGAKGLRVLGVVHEASVD